MKMLDLCCGIGGASAAMRERGWDVVGIDISPALRPTIIGDIRYNPVRQDKWDLVWASPPCIEFTKSEMSWRFGDISPDLTIFLNCLQIIQTINPRYWVIENVRGARKYFYPYVGKPTKKIGSRYLWGIFPPFYCLPVYGKTNLPDSKNRQILRSKIPYSISKSLCLAIEWGL